VTPDQAQHYVEQNTVVTQQLMTQAKTYAIERFSTEATQIVDGFLAYMDAQRPGPVVFGESADPATTLRAVTWHMACNLAICEAIWALVYSGVFVMRGAPIQTLEPRVPYEQRTSSSSSGGNWGFPALSTTYPREIQMGWALRVGAVTPLTDGDLYLQALDVEPLGPLVEESLREAVACFRHDLYTPALAMLTRAVEGAFTELALSLAGATETNYADRARRLRKLVTDPQTSLATLLDRVLAYYVDRDLSEPVWNRSGVAAAHMREVSIWAQGVRESRNVVHYRLRATLSNTYEKVAAYLLGAAPYMQRLRAATVAARSLAETSPPAAEA
jgi:hypothetical protein